MRLDLLQTRYAGSALLVLLGGVERGRVAIGLFAKACQKLLDRDIDGRLQGLGTHESPCYLEFESCPTVDALATGHPAIGVRLRSTSRSARLPGHVGAPVYTETWKLSFTVLRRPGQ